MGEETVETAGVVRKGKADVKASSAGLLFNGGEGGARVLEDGAAGEKDRELRMRKAGRGENGF